MNYVSHTYGSTDQSHKGDVFNGSTGQWEKSNRPRTSAEYESQKKEREQAIINYSAQFKQTYGREATAMDIERAKHGVVTKEQVDLQRKQQATLTPVATSATKTSSVTLPTTFVSPINKAYEGKYNPFVDYSFKPGRQDIRDPISIVQFSGGNLALPSEHPSFFSKDYSKEYETISILGLNTGLPNPSAPFVAGGSKVKTYDSGGTKFQYSFLTPAQEFAQMPDYSGKSNIVGLGYGVVQGGYSQIRNKPIETTATVLAGVGMSGIAGGLSIAGAKGIGWTAGKAGLGFQAANLGIHATQIGLEYGIPAAYLGIKGVQIYNAPTYYEKGQIIGTSITGEILPIAYGFNLGAHTIAKPLFQEAQLQTMENPFTARANAGGRLSGVSYKTQGIALNKASIQTEPNALKYIGEQFGIIKPSIYFEGSPAGLYRYEINEQTKITGLKEFDISTTGFQKEYAHNLLQNVRLSFKAQNINENLGEFNARDVIKNQKNAQNINFELEKGNDIVMGSEAQKLQMGKSFRPKTDYRAELLKGENQQIGKAGDIDIFAKSGYSEKVLIKSAGSSANQLDIHPLSDARSSFFFKNPQYSQNNVLIQTLQEQSVNKAIAVISPEKGYRAAGDLADYLDIATFQSSKVSFGNLEFLKANAVKFITTGTGAGAISIESSQAIPATFSASSIVSGKSSIMPSFPSFSSSFKSSISSPSSIISSYPKSNMPSSSIKSSYPSSSIPSSFSGSYPSTIIPPPVITPFIPPSLGFFGAGTGKTHLGKQKKKYQPSLVALHFNIKSAKIPRFAFTGLGVRPIISGRRKRRK